MLISHDHKFILFSNESTGSRAAYDTLSNLYGGVEYLQKHIHSPVPEEAKDYLPIITCREPFDRLTSAYHRIIQEKAGHGYYGRGVQWNTFQEFLNRYTEWFSAPRTNEAGESFYQCKWVGGQWMVIPWPQSFVYREVVSQCSRQPVLIRQESLQADIERLPFYRDEELPTIGKSEYRKEDFRTDENFAIVSDCLNEEYELLGYPKAY